MRCVIEFGNRGGAHTGSLPAGSAKQAARIAANLVHVFTNGDGSGPGHLQAWTVRQDQPRISWQSSSHFVSVSRLDDKSLPGPAAAKLWKKGD